MEINAVGTPDWASLPVPVDDGAARHLFGMRWPAIDLPSTTGVTVDVSRLTGWTIVFAYPRTGRPDIDNPPGWDLIPGARGCTPQACAFRDTYSELKVAGVTQLFGLSTQDNASQREAAQRLHLPFPLLSDADLKLTRTLRLPTFEVQGMTLLKRMTFLVRDSTIEHVFYPIFPPDQNAADVLNHFRGQSKRD
jgi:peroxiredoxin